MAGDEKVLAAATKSYEAWKNDCSGFLRAVAAELGVVLIGNADSIVASMAAGTGGWTTLADGATALAKAKLGKFVVAGLQGKDHVPARAHGHVVVIVDGALYHNKYPKCYGGSIGSAQSPGTKTVGEVWGQADRDTVGYYMAP